MKKYIKYRAEISRANSFLRYSLVLLITQILSANLEVIDFKIKKKMLWGREIRHVGSLIHSEILN
jgi:hypothetical protein